MKRNKIFKNSIKTAMIIALISIFIICLFGSTLKASAVSNTGNLVSTEKVYANTNIEENFDDSSVIVIIDRINSGINKSHENTIFKDVEFLEISDLTHVSDITTVTDVANFEQILKIKLKEPGKQNVINMINRLALIDGIKYAGPNRIFEIEKTPNDPLYSPITSVNGQWCHNNLQSENAWDFTTGSSNVRIGVIDTGISSHTDLVDNLAPGLDFVNMVENNPGIGRIDPDGHGTHVAGILGAVGNQSTATGVVGVNWNVTIVPMQVANTDGEINADACIRAINYASNIWNTSERISILSMSIGGDSSWPDIETAIRRYQGLFVCSTGNKEQNNDGTIHHYPSFYGSDMHTDTLQNMITVGRSDINDGKPTGANWGNRTIMLFAPGQNILSTYPEYFCTGIVRSTRWGYLLDCECTWYDGISQWVPNGTTHRSNGYHYINGSSMATPQVSGVAALLLSINPNLTTQQLKTAILESVDLPSINGSNPLENLCVTNGRLNAYNAVKYVLENYMNQTTYTLSNYSSTINTNKTIASDASYFNELNGFYKLNVTYAKNYEFISSSASGIEVTLYDEDFTEIPFNDLDSASNKVHFVKNLSIGTYYLRTKYISEDSTGTINTKIISRNTAYLTVGENDILINSYNGFRDYNFTNQNKPGFFKFAFVGEKEDGSLIVYPSNAIKIYNDSNKTQLLQKFDLGGYDNSASLKQNEDNMYVYLPRSGYFYLDVNFNTAGLKSLKLVITEATSDNLNLFDLSENTNETISVINETKKGDYFKALHLKQTGKFTVNFNYSGIQSNNILVVLTKQNYNETTREYSLDTKVIAFLNKDNPTYTYLASLEDGMYYIGYFNKADTSTVTTTFERLVTQSGSEVLVTDPDQGTLCGSQINIIEMNHFNKSYRQTFITVGFTRLIYPNYNYGISPSRLDYDWYSSNTSIATVTNYGTVLGKSAGTVKIMAVLKSDPSKVFVKEFTIINDIGSGIVEIHSTYTVKYSRDVVNGKFHFDIEKINCPYPWLQDYTWSLNNNCHGNSIGASMDNWGDITINGTGCFTLTGTYNVNSRYRVIIHFVIEP